MEYSYVSMPLVGLVRCYPNIMQVPAHLKDGNTAWMGYDEKQAVSFYADIKLDGSREYFAVKDVTANA